MTAPAPDAGEAPAYATVAPFYDRLLGEAGFEAIWAAFLRSRHRHRLDWREAGAADFGCGTGLFLAALARITPAGTPLHGVDRSPSMLRVARRRLAGRAVALGLGDIRSARLPAPVDLIVCNFATVNYLTVPGALRAFLRNVFRNLRYQGAFVFDTIVPGSAVDSPAVHQMIRVPGLRAEWRVVPRREGSRTTMRNCIPSGPASWSCSTEIHEQRWWRLDEVSEALEAAGLGLVAAAPVERRLSRAPGPRWLHIVARRLQRPGGALVRHRRRSRDRP